MRAKPDFTLRMQGEREVLEVYGWPIPPSPKPWEEAAAVICGHDFIQEMTDDRQAEFHSFVREVLRTVVGGARSHSGTVTE